MFVGQQRGKGPQGGQAREIGNVLVVRVGLSGLGSAVDTDRLQLVRGQRALDSGRGNVGIGRRIEVCVREGRNSEGPLSLNRAKAPTNSPFLQNVLPCMTPT